MTVNSTEVGTFGRTFPVAFLRWVCLLLFLSGCQPYPDHGEPIYDFRADCVDFGIRRELAVTRFQGDRRSLLIEFNQPLQHLEDEGKEAPFKLLFQPRVPTESTKREGAAGVRIVFEETLPPAQRYSASIPADWRALSGASFLKQQTISWTTPRPALESLEARNGLDKWEPTESLELTFNQEVEQSSIESKLRLTTVPQGQDVKLELPLMLRPIPGSERKYELSLPDLGIGQRYKIHFESGLRSEEGPLLGEDGAGFFFGPRPLFEFQAAAVQEVQEGEPFVLKFSEPVKSENLQRHLKGIQWDQAFLRTDDNMEFELHWPPERARGSFPRHIILLGSLRSMEGKRLTQDVDLVFTYPEKEVVASEWRDSTVLAPGTTVVPGKLSKGSTVSTWAVSPEQLAELGATTDERWNLPQKLSVELLKPVYSATLKKDAPRTRFLKNLKKTQKSKVFGAFLVRITTKDGAVKRLLFQRTDLRIETFGLNGLMSYTVRGNNSGVPKEHALVQVLDDAGQVLVAGQTDPQGQGSVSHDRLEAGRLMRVAKAADWRLAPFRYLEVATSKTLPGQVWFDGAVFETGATLHYFGCWWLDVERPDVVLVNKYGEPVETEIGPAEELGHLFKGRLTLPDEPGEYYLELPTADFQTPSYRVVVTEHSVLQEHPSQLTVSYDEDRERYKGGYAWNGPGADNLLIRALLRPIHSQHGGWRTVVPDQPHWLPLEVEDDRGLDGGEFEIEKLPELQGSWELLVELVDERDTSLVFRRETIRLGEREIDMTQLESKRTESNVKLVKFQFKLRRQLIDFGTESLVCLLELRTDAGWETLSKGEAVWNNGVYEWSGAIAEAGQVRLSCSWTDNSGERTAAWDSHLETDSVADWDSLELSSEVIFSSATPLEVRWPELPSGTETWLRAYSGETLLHNSLRTSEAGGSLGSLSLTNLGPGYEEVTILASHSDGKAIRGNRVEVMSLAHFLPASLKINRETQETYEVESESSLVINVEQSATTMKNALVWWAHDPEQKAPEDRLSVLEALVSSSKHPNTVLHGASRLSVRGPLELTENRELRLQAPAEPGFYNLHFLCEGEESNYYYSQVSVEVTSLARWKPLIPLVFRPGDEFSAGVRFFADPNESAPTGVTTSVVLDSSLLPVSYFNTAALVDPGDRGDMLFSYQAPDFIAPIEVNDFLLRWELGVVGEAVPVEAQLSPIPTDTEDSEYHQRVLESGEAMRLNLSGLSHWRADFEVVEEGTEESAQLAVVGLAGGGKSLEVSKPEARYVVGFEESYIEIRHLSGPDVRLGVVEMLPRLEANKERATSLYLMRRIENLDGLLIDKDELLISQEYLMSYHLVVPEKTERNILLSPVPGGIEPLGCWLKEPSGLLALGWSQEPGRVLVQLPELEPGEHEVLISCESIVDGRFYWPAGKVLDESGNLLARTLEQTVLILEE